MREFNFNEELIEESKNKIILCGIFTLIIIAFTAFLMFKLRYEVSSRQKSIQSVFFNLEKQSKNISDIVWTLGQSQRVQYREKYLKRVKDKINDLENDIEEFSAVVREGAWEEVEAGKTFNRENLNKLFKQYKSNFFEVKKKINNEEEAVSNRMIISAQRLKTILAKFTLEVMKDYTFDQKQILSSLLRLGIGFAVVITLFILFFWGAIFRPLYSTIITQHSKLVDSILKTESANRYKTDFLANISHEIRTPMTALLGYSDIIISDDASLGERREAATIINRNAHHLMDLIDDILDISKIEAGKVVIEKSSVNFKKLVEDVYSLLLVKAQEKDIQLNLEFLDSFKRRFLLDPKRVKQILFNVIGNAIKFTKNGEVKISCDLTSHCIEIRVQDTGVGVPKNSLKKIFKPFEQANSSVNRKFGGTGLGLSVSRELARKLGGDLILESSKVGEGSTFLIKVEAILAIEEKDQNDTSIRLKNSLNIVKNKKVLLVDDAKENLFLYKLQLEKHEVDVETANSGHIALDLLKSHEYDVILLDLQMPELDGYQVLRKIKSLDIKTPVLALTAHALIEEQEKTKRAGFHAHLVKPLAIEDLITRIAENIEVRYG